MEDDLNRFHDIMADSGKHRMCQRDAQHFRALHKGDIWKRVQGEVRVCNPLGVSVLIAEAGVYARRGNEVGGVNGVVPGTEHLWCQAARLLDSR